MHLINQRGKTMDKTEIAFAAGIAATSAMLVAMLACMFLGY